MAPALPVFRRKELPVVSFAIPLRTLMTFRNLLRCAAPVLFLTAALALPLLSAHYASAEDKANLSNDKQKYSYIIGSNIGRQMKNDGIDLDSTTFLSGLNDGLAGKESPLTQEEVRAV